MALSSDMLGEALGAVRSSIPLVHNITNYVTVHDVANIIIACGGSPIMSDEPEDVADLALICGGLNINIGTLNKRSIEAMRIAAEGAARRGNPILLDPVGAGASRLRTETAKGLMRDYPITVIRGNISEITALADGSGSARGVDANADDLVTTDNLKLKADFAKAFALKHGVVVAITGAIDLVSDGRVCYAVHNGSWRMGTITGSGCQLSGLMTAFLVANRERPLVAALAALCTMGLAGEIADSRMAEGDGNSTYGNRLIDAVSLMTPEVLSDGARFELL